MTESVQGNLFIELLVECPHCDETFDLLGDELPYNDEGHIINQCCPDKGHWTDKHSAFEEDVTCPHCNNQVNVVGIKW